MYDLRVEKNITNKLILKEYLTKLNTISKARRDQLISKTERLYQTGSGKINYLERCNQVIAILADGEYKLDDELMSEFLKLISSLSTESTE